MTPSTPSSAVTHSLLALAIVAATSASAAPLQTLGKAEGVVDIIAWPGYIERGESDKQYDWVTQF